MTISKRIAVFFSFFLTLSSTTQVFAQIGMRELGDSIMSWTGFSRVWSPTVRVKQMRVNGDNIVLKTNLTLHDVRWTPDNIIELKRKVSFWTLGHARGKVTIYTGTTNIESLVTDCALQEKHQAVNSCKADLTDRTIVLYPSHGMYFNRERQEWIWQRATLWTTVEDVYSQEYVRQVRQMLENAGATVLSPRADLVQQDLGLSGMPQWTEGARYWLQAQGTDSTLWNLYEGDEYKDDMKCRAIWVNAQEMPIDLCIALHTDGLDSESDSTIIGTLAIYTAKDDDGHTVLRDGRDRATTNRNLADFVQTQVVKDLSVLAPRWTRRQLKEANYCESRVPVVPSMILELLSHKNMADMKYGLDPTFRFAAARAVYKGILRYLNGSEATVQPLPVTELGIGADGVLRWKPTIDSIEPTATPGYYMVYIQENDGEWDVQQVDKSTYLQVELKPDVRYNYYVVAGNEGGLSMPSPTISAYINGQQDHERLALIIDGFSDSYGPEWFADSTYAGIIPGSYACENYFSCAYIGEQWDYTRSHKWVNDDNCGFGSCYRDHAGQFTIGNTHDYAVQHGRSLRKMKISYVSCTAGMAQIDSNYTLVDYVCGRQRDPLPGKMQKEIGAYLDNGGKILLSTDHFSAINASWAKRYLSASYHAANATRSGRINGQRHRLYLLCTTPNEEQLFSPSPQALKPEKNAVRIAGYEDMRCTAGVGTEHTLVYGFPLEAIQDFEKIYKHSIQWLLQEE